MRMVSSLSLDFSCGLLLVMMEVLLRWLALMGSAGYFLAFLELFSESSYWSE